MARPPDRLPLIIKSVNEFPVVRIQPPNETGRNATQRHPVAVVPRSVIRNGVDEAVASIFPSTTVFAVLHEKGIAEDATWEHRVSELGSRAPGQTVIRGFHDARVPGFLDPEMMSTVHAGVPHSVVPVPADRQIEHAIDAGQAGGLP